jgi:hypothetical protein
MSKPMEQGWWRHSLEQTYQTFSTASVEVLWQKVIDLADLASWHPLIHGTNAPQGLIAKPGLIYRVFARWWPLSTKIFVETVRPGELLSVRIFPVPGLEERVSYRIESTVWGSRISYSITLRGWLSPLAWSFLRPFAERVASALAQAAEQAMLATPKRDFKPYQGWFVIAIALFTLPMCSS